MASPKKRRSNNTQTNQPSNLQTRDKVTVQKNSEPFIVDANVANPTDSLGLHSIVGHLDLDPYAWITLYGDSEELATRNGLKALHISNEESKYPRASFSIFVPDYRDAEDGQRGKDYFVPSEPGRPITKFHLGAVFYINWGYKSNNIKWGPFRVTERSISFEEGTAILRVTGLIASRLKSIITAEVFDTTPEESAIHKMAKKAGLNVSTQYLTSEEKQRLFSDTKLVTTKGDDLGQVIYKKCRELDIDMRFSTDGRTLYLVTPFKGNLRKKPYKLTYGYPTSNISTIDIQTKHPIKKGQTPNFVTRLNQPITQTGGLIEERVFRIAVHGPLQYIDSNNQKKEFITGGVPLSRAMGVWIFPTYRTDDYGNIDTTSESNQSNAQVNAEKRWKVEEGFIVSAIQGGKGAYPTSVHNWSFLIEREIKVKGVIIQEDVTFNDLNDYYQKSEAARTLSVDNIKEVYILKTNTADKDGKFQGIKYSLGSTETQEDQRTESSSQEDKHTQIESIPNVTDDTKEGYEFIDIKDTAVVIDTDILRNKESVLKSGTEESIAELEAYNKAVSQLQERVKSSNGQLGFREETKGEITGFVLTQKVRKDPANPKTESNKKTNTSDTSSSSPDKPNSSFTPATMQSGVGRPSRRLTTTDVNIKFKAGDYRMNVGEHLRIDSLHKKLDGVYFIYKEEHSIDVNGFHTTVSCKRAVGTLKNKYGNELSKDMGEGQDINSRKAVGVEKSEKAAIIDKQKSDQILQTINKEYRQRRNSDAYGKQLAKEKQNTFYQNRGTNRLQ